MSLKHTTLSGKADGSDATQIQPSNWNEDHAIDSGGATLTSGVAAVPSTPAAGKVVLFARAPALAGHVGVVDESGIASLLQPSLAFKRVAAVTPANLATAAIGTMFNVVGTSVTNVSPTTPTTPALASTSYLTQTRRANLITAATANSLASHTVNRAECWRGSSAGRGGFLFVARFGTEQLATSMRVFVGLADTFAPANADPTTSTTPGKMGMAINVGSGNWSFVTNVTGTAPTATALGANFPVNTTAIYELILFCAPSASTVYWYVTNLETGNTTSGSVTTNLPSTTTFIGPNAWVVNVTAATAQLAISRWYLQSEA